MKLILLVLDGWGYSGQKEGNAIAATPLPTFNYIEQFYPSGLLKAAGISVGLPWGEAGNSEVGHLTLGSGRVILQHMPYIIGEIRSKDFFKNEALLKAVNNAKEKGTLLHLVGMVGSGSVHSYIDHLYALLDLAKEQGISDKVRLHLFTDGKDSPPREGVHIISKLKERLEATGQGRIASIIGRDYGMNRDLDWEKTKKAFDVIVKGEGEKTKDEAQTIKQYYEQGYHDNTLPPIVATDEEGNPVGRVSDQDSMIFFDFREDSERQLAKTFALPGEVGFDAKPPHITFVMFTRYDKNIDAPVAFETPEIVNTFADVLEQNGKKQLHVGEIEKYAHITYFFNGLHKEPHAHETWIPVPTIENTKFLERPEMSTPETTQTILEAVKKGEYDVIVANFANADTIGHLGNFAATQKACQAIDSSVKEIVRVVEEKEDVAFAITADHGHVERMVNERTGEHLTEHTDNEVPFYFVYPKLKRERSALEVMAQRQNNLGLLADVAPTLLELMGLPIPNEMTGKSFLQNLMH